MIHSISRFNAIPRHPFEHHRDQIGRILHLLGTIPLFAKEFLEGNAGEACGLADNGKDLIFNELPQAGEFIFCGRSDHTGLLKNLKALSVPGEERGAGQELEKNAADRPDINRIVVLISGKNQFRSSVVATHDIRGIFTGAWLLINEFRRAEITNLHHAILDQDVFWLQISVDNPQFMHILQSVQDFFGVSLNISKIEVFLGALFQLLKYIFKILITELKH